MPELGGRPGGPVPPPQYFADQLTLFQPRGSDSAHPLLPAPPKFFTFRHHCFCIFSANLRLLFVNNSFSLSYLPCGNFVQVCGKLFPEPGPRIGVKKNQNWSKVFRPLKSLKVRDSIFFYF